MFLDEPEPSTGIFEFLLLRFTLSLLVNDPSVLQSFRLIAERFGSIAENLEVTWSLASSFGSIIK